MSEQARRETVRYARVASGIDRVWNCELATEFLVRRSEAAGGLGQARRASVVGVNIEGNRATVSVLTGRGPITTVPMVREDGEWKLGERPGTMIRAPVAH